MALNWLPRTSHTCAGIAQQDLEEVSGVLEIVLDDGCLSGWSGSMKTAGREWSSIPTRTRIYYSGDFRSINRCVPELGRRSSNCEFRGEIVKQGGGVLSLGGGA